MLPPPENDFQAHADMLAAYQQIQTANVIPTAPGAFNVPGTVVYGMPTPFPVTVSQGKVYAAVILPVTEHQFPREMGGGFVPGLSCTVSINKNLLPAAVNFQTGQIMVVNPVWSGQRLCQIHSFVDCFTSWLIALMDISESA